MAGIKQINRQQDDRPKSKRTPKDVLNQDEWLLKSLDELLDKTSFSSKGGKFYPSHLGNTCDRALYLAFNGLMPSQPIPALTRRIFDCGSSLEYRFKRYFDRLGVLIATEKSVQCASPPISGRMDFVIRHEEYHIIPIELKSINNKGFLKLIKEPKPEHYLQLQIYMVLGNFNNGVVLYENKDNQQLKAFVLERDDKCWNDLLERCYRIMAMTTAPKKCTGNKYCKCKEV